MEYISVIEAAEKWGITRRRVQVLCNEGRISGAKKIGTVWIIPDNATKPVDKRIERNTKDYPNKGE